MMDEHDEEVLERRRAQQVRLYTVGEGIRSRGKAEGD